MSANKPSMDVLCPVTSKKLRMKDLTAIKFTPASVDVPNSFMDPVSNDMLNNSSKLVAIKSTGDVMLEKTYKTCIKPDGIYKGVLLLLRRVTCPLVYMPSNQMFRSCDVRPSCVE